jgi:selenide,water dikinase
MTNLNKAAAEAMVATTGVHACTDITGFGLIGHAAEIAAASRVTLQIKADSVPLLEGVLPLVSRHRSGGMATNRKHFSSRVAVPDGLDPDLHDLLYDPQTSGGLLMVVAPEDASALDAALGSRGVSFWTIGRVVNQDPTHEILVV